MMDMRGLVSVKVMALAMKPDCGHAQVGGRFQVDLHILEHAGAPRVELKIFNDRMIRFGIRLGYEAGVLNRENMLEMVIDAEMFCHPLRKTPRRVGENDLFTPQALQILLGNDALRNIGNIKVMGIIKKMIRIDFV